MTRPSVETGSAETVVAADGSGDREIVEACRRGDRSAFTLLYRRHAPTVHGVLLARVGRADAEDLTQETFVRAWKSLWTLREPGAVGSWLCQIARNLAATLVRGKGPAAVPLPGDAEEKKPVADGDSYGLAEAVLGAIRTLPEAYRETLVLRLVQGMPGPAIAERMGMTHGSVRINLHRGMEMLREKLKGAQP